MALTPEQQKRLDELSGLEAVSLPKALPASREEQMARLTELEAMEPYKPEEVPVQRYEYASGSGGGRLGIGMNQRAKKQQEVDKIDFIQNIADQVGASTDDLDMENEAGLGLRMKLSTIPTMQEKAQVVADEYGRKNVRVVNTGDSEMFMFRDAVETEGKWVPFDSQRLNLTDVAEFAGKEAAPAIAGIAGLRGGPVASAGAYATTGIVQDTLTRSAFGLKQQGFDSITGRSIEGGIQLATDYATRGLSRIVGRAFGTRYTPDVVTENLTLDAKHLNDKFKGYGIDIELTPAMKASSVAADKEKLLSSQTPDGRISKAYQSIRDQVAGLRDALRPSSKVELDVGEVYSSFIARVQGKHAKLINDVNLAKANQEEILSTGTRKAQEIAKKKSELEQRAITQKLKRREENLLAQKYTTPLKSGTAVHKGLSNQLKLVKSQSKKLYNESGAALKREGAEVTPSEIKGAMQRSLRALNLPQLTPDGYLNTLSTKIDESLARTINDIQEAVNSGDAVNVSIRELDSWLSNINYHIPKNKKTGFNATQKAATQLNRKLSALRFRAMQKASEPTRRAYKAAKDYYKNELVPFDDKRLKLLVDRNKNNTASDLTPESISGKALTDATTVKAVLKGSGYDPEVRDALRDAYLVKINDSSTLKFDEETVRSLWGQYKVDSLKATQGLLKKHNAKPSDIPKDEMNNLISAQTQTAMKEAQGRIDEALKQQAEFEGSIQKGLLTRIIKKETGMPEDAPTFVKELVGMRPSEINSFMGMFPNETEKLTFQQSAFDLLLSNAKAFDEDVAQLTGPSRKFTPIWDAAEMRKALGEPKDEIRAKWVALLGKDAVDDILSTNNVLKSSSKLNRAQQQSQIAHLTTVMTSSGKPRGVLVFGGAPSWAWRKLLNASYGSKSFKPLMEYALNTRELNEEVYKKMFNTLLYSTRGVEALAREMDNDPDFEAYARDLISKNKPE